MTDLQSQISRPLCAAYICFIDTRSEYLFSLDAQLRQTKEHAASEGLELVKIYSDQTTREFKHKYRPGIVQMLMKLPLRVRRIDHLVRRLEWAIEIVKKLHKADVTLKAVEQNFDPETPVPHGCVRRMTTLEQFDKILWKLEFEAPAPMAGSHQAGAAIQDPQR